MGTTGTLIELHVPDFVTTKEFYKKLGFSVAWETAPVGKNGYLVLTLEENVLCFWGGSAVVFEQSYFKNFPPNTHRGYGVEVVLQVKNLQEYYDKVSQVVQIYEPLRERPWGLDDFRLADPFGFYLRVTSHRDIRKGPSEIPSTKHRST